MLHVAQLEIMGEAEWLPPADFRVYQSLRVAEVVRHARQTTPFHRSGLDHLLDADGSLDWAAWERQPLLARSGALEHEIAMHSLRIPAAHGSLDYMRTAGRTADPFSVPWTDFAFVIEDCVRTRLYRWHDIDPRGTLLVVAEDADRPRRELAHWDGAMRALNIPGRRIRIAATLGAEAVADAIRTEQPDVLEIPVALLREVLARASASGETLPPVETVIAWGAPVDDGLRALCGDVLSARIVETYRMMEVGILGIACPKGAGLHLMADACLAEIVDADGRPCAPGEAGEIVVTPFFNAAMPLIRYCTGDRATRLPACPCGRALPRVTGIRRATIAHEENHAG